MTVEVVRSSVVSAPRGMVWERVMEFDDLVVALDPPRSFLERSSARSWTPCSPTVTGASAGLQPGRRRLPAGPERNGPEEENVVMTVKLKSVSMGPLSDLLEQWWATVTISCDGCAPTLARLSVSWSPATNRFTPEHDGSSILEAGDGEREVGVDEAIAAFLASPEKDRAYAAIRAHALRHRDDFPERVAVMESSH